MPTGVAVHAPPYDAYREFSRGLEAYRRYEIADALRSFVRAGDADPDFVLSSLFAAMCAVEEGGVADPSVLESLLTDLERRSRLTEYEREWVAYFRARASGDTEAGYRAMRRAASMAPGSRAEWWLGRAALEFNRPGEAVRVFEGLDPESEPLRGWLPYWIFKTRALHLLGDHTPELTAARLALARPGWLGGCAAEPWSSVRLTCSSQRVPGTVQGSKCLPRCLVPIANTS